MWSEVVELADTLFALDHRQVDHSVVRSTVARLLFPPSLTVVVDSNVRVKESHFKQRLAVLTEHRVLYAWYNAMYDAITTGNQERLSALWQAALTVTIHCRVGLPIDEQAVLSMQVSKQSRTEANLESDSFMAFARKALVVLNACPDASRFCTNNLPPLNKKAFGSTPRGLANLCSQASSCSKTRSPMLQWPCSAASRGSMVAWY